LQGLRCRICALLAGRGHSVLSDAANQLKQVQVLGPSAVSAVGESHALSQLQHCFAGFCPVLTKDQRFARTTVVAKPQHQVGLPGSSRSAYLARKTHLRESNDLRL
jgi:16S rRNA C1402 (ribose-2'-O) methylase RsmI